MLFTIPNVPIGSGGYWSCECYYLPDFTDFCSDMLLRMGLFKDVLDKQYIKKLENMIVKTKHYIGCVKALGVCNLNNLRLL